MNVFVIDSANLQSQFKIIIEELNLIKKQRNKIKRIKEDVQYR